MISHEVTEWRFFRAIAGSEAAKKLDKAEKTITDFAADFFAFKQRHADKGEIVALAEMGAWAPEIVRLGIETPTQPAPSDAWVETRQKNVFSPQTTTEFHAAQSEILGRLRQLSHPNFVWMLGDGGDKDNHPSLGNLFREIPDGFDDRDKLPKSIIEVKSAEAFHLGDEWLLVVPVNPENGKFYRPPGCGDIGIERLPQLLKNRKIEELPPFHATRPLGTIKTYEGVMYYS